MQYKKFNISKPKKFISSSGEEKTQWSQIGVMTEFHKDDGSISRILEIPAIGLEANIFPFKENEEVAPRAPRTAPPAAASSSVGDAPAYPTEELNPEDIPF